MELFVFFHFWKPHVQWRMKCYLKHVFCFLLNHSIWVQMNLIYFCLLFAQMDLVSTIGESVALGVAGVILWGDSNHASSQVRLWPNQGVYSSSSHKLTLGIDRWLFKFRVKYKEGIMYNELIIPKYTHLQMDGSCMVLVGFIYIYSLYIFNIKINVLYIYVYISMY